MNDGAIMHEASVHGDEVSHEYTPNVAVDEGVGITSTILPDGHDTARNSIAELPAENANSISNSSEEPEAEFVDSADIQHSSTTGQETFESDHEGKSGEHDEGALEEVSTVDQKDTIVVSHDTEAVQAQQSEDQIGVQTQQSEDQTGEQTRQSEDQTGEQTQQSEDQTGEQTRQSEDQTGEQTQQSEDHSEAKGEIVEATHAEHPYTADVTNDELDTQHETSSTSA